MFAFIVHSVKQQENDCLLGDGTVARDCVPPGFVWFTSYHCLLNLSPGADCKGGTRHRLWCSACFQGLLTHCHVVVLCSAAAVSPASYARFISQSCIRLG